MRQRIQIIIYSWILILCADLNAKAIETLVPEKALVAEKIRYELKWDNGEIKNVRFPEIGLHFSEDLPDIPRFEISYSEKKESSLTVDFVFYVTGEHSIPISWEDANGKRNFPKNGFSSNPRFRIRIRDPPISFRPWRFRVLIREVCWCFLFLSCCCLFSEFMFIVFTPVRVRLWTRSFNRN